MTDKYLTATTKNIRGSARKFRLTADLVRGSKANDALQMLELLNRKASKPIAKTIKSALSNAAQKGVNPDELKIKSIRVNEAARLIRYRAAAKGIPSHIRKPGCHIYIELGE